MKQNLLLCAALFAASSAWAAVPTSVTLRGEALAEEATVECTKVADGKFEAYALLNGGKTLTAAGGDLSLDATPADKGVYRITVDGNTSKLEIKKIVYFGLWPCWAKEPFEMKYAGKGVFAGSFNWSKLSNQDDRYQLVMRYTREDDKNYKFGPVNRGNDYAPDDNRVTDLSTYYDLTFYADAGEWDPKWKMANKYRNSNNYLVVATMRGAKFTHSITDIPAIPQAVTVSGSALTESASLNLNKVDEVTFEAFTKLKAGDLRISDGTNEYVIDNGILKKGAGVTTIAKDGVYCINIDMATNVSSVKEVNSIKFYPLGKFGPSGESLSYIGNGEWLGAIDIPADENIQFNPNDYRIEMLLDNEIQHWGNAGDKNLKRVYWSFWGNAFNFGKAIKGEKFNLRANFGTLPYNHSFEAYDPTAGIEDITVDNNAPVEYYNLQGMRVENPANGIFIRRQGNKATKILVK